MAFAGTEAQKSLSDIAGNANEEAITVNFNLGIIDGMGDGTFAPDQAVTRAQFAAMITRAMAVPQSALAGYTATSFKDTAGYGWAVPYLAFCQSKGILVGDGAGNVMPGKTVSVNEAMAMVLRAIGYTNNSAALVGVWPANYVSLAQNNDLYDDVATAVGVTRGNAAQIIYNVLTVDKVEVAADGTTKVLSDRSNGDSSKWKIVNLLTTGLSCTSEEDYIIKGNEDTLISLKAYVGQKVTVYRNSDKEIIAIASVQSDAVTGSFDTDVKVTTSGSSIILSNAAKFVEDNDDETEYTVDTTAVGSYFVNGEKIAPVGSPTGTAITSADSVTINGEINGKYIDGIDSITKWDINQGRAAKVSKSDLAQIADDELLGGEFETLKGGDIDTTSFALVGVTSLDKIAVDNVVYVYWKTGTASQISKVEVGTEVVTGDVTKVNNTKTKFTVNGKTYEMASKPDAKSETMTAGDTVKLYLDVNGDIYFADVTSGATDNYGYVTGYDKTYDKVKLYVKSDESKWFEFDSDYAATVSAISNGALAAYSVDSKGVIDNIVSDVKGPATATLSGLVLTTTGAGLNTSYRVDADATVFGISGSSIEVATSIGNVDTNKAMSNVKFILDDGVIVAMVVPYANATKTDDDTYAVIHEVSSVKNADGDKVQQIVGFADGVALDKLTTGSTTADTAASTTAPALFKIEYDADGAVKKVDASYSRTGLLADVNDKVADIDGNSIKTSTGAVWVYAAKDVVVYKAVIKDGVVDSYKVSDLGAINKGYNIYMYDTTKEDDNAGYEVVIFADFN